MSSQPDEHSVCATMGDILNRIGDKWSVMVVGRLRGGTMRFSQLLRAIDGVSQRMLTLTLRLPAPFIPKFPRASNMSSPRWARP